MVLTALLQYGFSEKEAHIYLALLRLGRATVSDISTDTKLPRSTIYSILEPLQQKGAIFAYEHKKIFEFAPQPPHKLFHELQERAQLFKQALPELKEIYARASTQPQIRYYVGKDELLKMYASLLTRRSLKNYDIIAAEREWLELAPSFLHTFKLQRAEKGIATRMILEYSDAAQKRKVEEAQTLSHVKILPPALSAPFHGGCYIFSDSVIFVAYRKEHVAVEILSPEITSVLQTMFNFMWKFLS